MKTESISIRKNYALNLASEIIAVVVPLITTPYLARVLGALNIGEYSFKTSLVSYFAFFAAFGVSTYGNRLIASCRDDKEAMSNGFWEVFLLKTITSVVALVVYFLSVVRIYKFDKLTIIIALNIINVGLDVSWVFIGLENFRDLTIRNIAAKLLNLVLVFLLVKRETDLLVYALISLGCIVLSSGSMIFQLPQYIGKPTKKINPFANIKEVFLVYLPSIAAQVYTIFDKSMIGWITKSSYQNGCYEESEKIVRVALTVITSASAVFIPRIAHLFAVKDFTNLKKHIYKVYDFAWHLALPMIFGCIAVASVFIPIYLGPGFDLSVDLLKIFSLLILFVSLAYITGLTYLIPTKQQNVYTVSVSISAVINLALNAMLIKTRGAVGAAIASVIAEGVGIAVQLAYCFVKKQLSFKEVFKSVPKCLLAGIIMFVVLNLIQTKLPVSVTGLLITVVCGAFTYFAVLFILRDSFLLNTAKSFLKRSDLSD